MCVEGLGRRVQGLGECGMGQTSHVVSRESEDVPVMWCSVRQGMFVM